MIFEEFFGLGTQRAILYDTPVVKRAQQHVQRAHQEQDPQDKATDWIVDAEISVSWSRGRRTKPSYVRPCFTHGSEFFWIWPRGKHFTVSEMIRIQGFVVTDFLVARQQTDH